ncbi:MAG: DUF2330 domain-containing protein [Myxococcota bacterium]
MTKLLRGGLAASLLVVLLASRPVEACGCFAPPSAAEPVIQAGERILFAVRDGKVIAHIQLQYSGDAKDFGWLLPLPSVPTLRLGSDELFTRLAETTDPTFTSEFRGNGCPRSTSVGCGARAALNTGRFASEGVDAGASVLLTQSSIGPYDYAVLRADDRTAMFQWLADNRYFVPAGTDDAVGPYIHPGAYFLALKLKAGASAGDVTPVVLEYPSALPMIPIVLTRVGATPNMGIQVWLLGNGRGIPRNYHHVVINDALLDWLNNGQNYSQLVTRAVSAAPDKHAFVTDYAGPSEVMKDQLVPPGRFGTEAELAKATTPAQFVDTLLRKGFIDRSVAAGSSLPPAVVRLLLTDIPMPAPLAAKGVSPNQFLLNLGFYLGDYRTQNPDDFTGWTLAFDAPSLAQQVFAEFVTPLREANALFAEFPKLTRLYTTLSPEDMTADPVFSFNPSLPDVARAHTSSFVMSCNGNTFTTEQGWMVEDLPALDAAPAALRVEVLTEEGAPTVVVDNTRAIAATFKRADAPNQGCTTVDPMSLGLLVLMAALRRRRA